MYYIVPGSGAIIEINDSGFHTKELRSGY